MKLKKYLQQQVENNEQSLLTENDELFCMQLAEETGGLPARTISKKKVWTGVSGALAIMVCAAIVIPVVLTRGPGNGAFYKIENIIQRVCDLDELNSDLNYFEVVQCEDVEVTYKLNYDSISNDHLYYIAFIYTPYYEFILRLNVNENFDLNFEIGEELVSKELSDYTIRYEMLSLDSIGNLETQYRGVITLNEEIVYVEYTSISGSDDQTFFDDLQSVLKVKN